MDKKIVASYLGRVLMVLAGLLIIPLIVGLYFKEDMLNILSFAIAAGLALGLGFFVSRFKSEEKNFSVKDGFGIAVGTWGLASLIGCLPFYISGQIPSLVDAIFETTSGFTTTGASILTDVELLSKSMLFWRSFTHFIGGMGILVFTIALMPPKEKGSVYAMKAEVPGPEFGKLTPRLSISAKILYQIYIVLTMLVIFALFMAKMPLFDSVVHAFGIAGTGGFSIKASSIGFYKDPLIEVITSVGMIVFGINFNLFYMLVLGSFDRVFKNEELRLYLGIVAGSTLLIAIDILSISKSGVDALRDAFFAVSSIISTTGYGTADFALWPSLSHIVLLGLMFTGAMAGSTAGGFKVSRLLKLLKSIRKELALAINPRRVVEVKEDGGTVEDRILDGTKTYLAVYILVLFLQILIISLENFDFETTISAVMATFNNIGPGIGLVGPTGSYAGFSVLSKLTLTLGMLIGRLEIFPILVLMFPGFWDRRN